MNAGVYWVEIRGRLYTVREILVSGVALLVWATFCGALIWKALHP